MKIKQFEDKGLAHYSYAILSECDSEIVLIDPSRDISEYLDFAKRQHARVVGVIETHPHADFISGHLELHELTGATLYCSKLVGATYPHQGFDEGNELTFGKIKLKALNTPGHSPDSICIVLEHEGKDKAVFTGDTLFIGDCGRPDLREKAGEMNVKREELARQMYYSLREKLMPLADDVIVYPAHGAGTLCGKALSEASDSTIGAEKISNWSLKDINEKQFVTELTADQPFVPQYFPYDVDLNKHGAQGFEKATKRVPIEPTIDNPLEAERLEKMITVIDTRPSAMFKQAHLPGSINLMNGEKFETWLGSLMAPQEAFYLAAKDEADLQEVIARTAKIGYELFVKGAFVLKYGEEGSLAFDLDFFKKHLNEFTIIDVRNKTEHSEHPIFKNSINIPLPELQKRYEEIPTDRPIAVHCAGGYRSAAGSSIIAAHLKGETGVYDISSAIKEFDHS